MLTLGNIFVLMLLATGAAWVWHNHGLRERALARVKQHCAKLDIELLDGAVALKRIGFVKDANGRRRLARVSGVAHQFVPLEADFMARRAARFAWRTRSSHATATKP